MAYVYILKLRDGKYYTGSCREIKNRLKQHEQQKVKSTKYRLPFLVVYTKQCTNYSTARKEELRIKGWKKRKSIENLIKFDKQNMVNGSIV